MAGDGYLLHCVHGRSYPVRWFRLPSAYSIVGFPLFHPLCTSKLQLMNFTCYETHVNTNLLRPSIHPHTNTRQCLYTLLKMYKILAIFFTLPLVPSAIFSQSRNSNSNLEFRLLYLFCKNLWGETFP